MRAVVAAAFACAAAASVPAALRWLRVAQREHYLPRSACRFALRWWASSPTNIAAGLVGTAAALAAPAAPPAALAAAAVAAAAPFGLSVRGRTSKLGWTRRMRSLAALVLLLGGGAVASAAAAAGLGAAAAAGALVAVGMPLLVDAALALAAPVEGRIAERYVAEASRRVAAVRPRIVAITGSYGKTSTKGYLAQLLEGRFAVVASPRSFNNRPGLARTVNEHLVAGTDVLVAEMGTYGPGEIDALCAWLPPEVAVMTAIGPVHLERFGTVEAILAAKTEITGRARTCVLNTDDARLDGLAEQLAAAGKRVVRCSGSCAESSDVAVTRQGQRLLLYLDGRLVGWREVAPARMPPALSNVACAAGAALALGCAAEEILARFDLLEGAANRLALERSAAGVTILDDTYNSNPAGAALALDALARLELGPSARRVVVTPGMVELGSLQPEANVELARRARAVATDIVIVGRTNRRSLLEGAGTGSRRPPGAPAVRCVARREHAVAWVRAELQDGDAVLYENDLPDHFP